MSLVSSWGEGQPRDLDAETAPGLLFSLSEDVTKELFFASLRAGVVNAIRNILTFRPYFLHVTLWGYEGSDVKRVIPNSTSGRCYHYTGHEKDGYFSALHVAAEGGNKILVLLLLQAGADTAQKDYRGHTAEEVSTGSAVHAFYEMRGLVFEELYRYSGAYDRYGKKTRVGTLFYKKPGYHEDSHMLYNGSWKDDKYDGNGTLYYPGTDTVSYVGRFKRGMKQGRGIDFDTQGKQVYVGSFRDNLRDGHGELFEIDKVETVATAAASASDNRRLVYKGIAIVYKTDLLITITMAIMAQGEFLKGKRHGFGVQYISGEGHKYIGRFDHDSMSGLGILYQPSGDRYEGMFSKDKPDGPGSYYQKNSATGAEDVKNAIWALGKPVKETSAPFVPKAIDLPADRIADQMALLTLDTEDGRSDARKKIDSILSSNLEVVDWKNKLGRYLKLGASEAKILKLSNQTEDSGNSTGSDEVEGSDVDINDQPDGMDGGDYEDISNYHFVDIPGLFVSYAYVCAAAKVFEKRESTRELRKLPDFEQVYHLVIDAVELYNETWEEEYIKSVQSDEKQDETSSTSSATIGSGHILEVEGSLHSSVSAAEERQSTKTKRLNYMSAAEIREETLSKQRQEIALKLGNVHLNPLIEKRIGTKIIESLRGDLIQLLEEDNPTTNSDTAVKTTTEMMTKDRRNTIIPGSNSRPSNECNNTFAEELLEIIYFAGVMFPS